MYFFFFQAEDGIRDFHVTGVQTCALPIYAIRVGRIGGDRLLVVEVERRRFTDQGRRLTPRDAAVHRLADENARRQQVGARREADLVGVTVRRERDPRVGGAVEISAVCGRAARARAEVGERPPPRLTAVE